MTNRVILSLCQSDAPCRFDDRIILSLCHSDPLPSKLAFTEHSESPKPSLACQKCAQFLLQLLLGSPSGPCQSYKAALLLLNALHRIQFTNLYTPSVPWSLSPIKRCGYFGWPCHEFACKLLYLNLKFFNFMLKYTSFSFFLVLKVSNKIHDRWTLYVAHIIIITK